MKKINMDEYKHILLGILIKIDQICRDENIPYVIFYGTLLGAVRHKGFIPWDDDIDIAVPREHFSRLQNAINAVSKDYNINFIFLSTNPDTIYSGGKICDTTTTLNESTFKPVTGYGAFIDVFPFDNFSENRIIRSVDFHYCRMLHKLEMHSSMVDYEKTDSAIRNILRSAAYRVTRPIKTQKLLNYMINHFQKFNKKKTQFIGLPYERFSFDRTIFDNPIELEFEGHMFKAPRDYDAVLKERYGDYMTLPPESARVNKHTLNCYQNN